MRKNIALVALSLFFIVAVICLCEGWGGPTTADVTYGPHGTGMTTIDHDNHRFVLAWAGATGVALLHHPDCPCYSVPLDITEMN